MGLIQFVEYSGIYLSMKQAMPLSLEGLEESKLHKKKFGTKEFQTDKQQIAFDSLKVSIGVTGFKEVIKYNVNHHSSGDHILNNRTIFDKKRSMYVIQN